MSKITAADLAALTIPQLRELSDEIARLIAEKTESEKAALLADLEKQAAARGFTLAALLMGTAPTSSGKGKAKPGKGGRGTVAPKYRNPANALETWSGRGRQPAWVQAHVAGGGTLDSLAIAAIRDQAAE